jgi:general secretion pathway protein K
MKISISRKDRAFAVIIALVAVTVLTILAGAFAYAMKVETKLAANTNDDEEFYWIGRGGVERACWQLSFEGGPFTSLHQYWNHGEGDGPETNSPLAGESMDGIPIGQGTVSLTIEEQEMKININTASAPLLQQVLTTQGADADAISVVSDSVLDWISPGDAPRPAGAKSDYYLGLTPPYYCKNGPIDNLDELQLIKGVTRDMYNGGNSSGATTPFPEHQLGFGHAPGQEPVYTFGLKDVFTPYSSGKINLLTASENVLELIPGIDTAGAQAIVSERESTSETGGEIRTVQQLLAAAGIDPQVVGQVMNFVDIRGNTYEVHARVTIGQLTHEYTAVVFRNGPNVTVFNFYRSK